MTRPRAKDKIYSLLYYTDNTGSILRICVTYLAGDFQGDGKEINHCSLLSGVLQAHTAAFAVGLLLVTSHPRQGINQAQTFSAVPWYLMHPCPGFLSI